VSFDALRRSVPSRAVIAATSLLAVGGGSLAIAASASATALPATGTTSLTSVLNSAETGLVQAAEVDQAASSNGVPETLPTTPAITAPSDLTSTNVGEIVADWANTANQPPFEAILTEEEGSPAAGDAAYTALAKAIPGAAEVYGQVPDLLALDAADTTDYPNGLFSVDGDLQVTSTATPKAVGAPTASTITVSTDSAATGGYVFPSSFSLQFPTTYSINTGLIGKEITAGQESAPPASDAIGTVTLKSPAVQYEKLGTGNTLTGKVYVVASPSATDPSFELSILPGVYELGALSGITPPITVTFGDTSIGEPLPFSSVSLSFPASSSPLEASSCKALGSDTGSATDEVASLAFGAFGDTTDGYGASSTTATPVSAAAVSTVVSNLCAPTASGAKVTGVKKGKPVVKLTVAGNGGTKFTKTTIVLPKGVTAKGLKSKDLKVSSAKLKSVKVSGQKVTLTLKSAAKKATVDFAKGLKETKKVKKEKSLKFGVTVVTSAGTSASKSESIKVKS